VQRSTTYRTATDTVSSRFWSKTKRNEQTGCLEWTAGFSSNGYGSFKWDGQNQSAHTFAWFLYTGDFAPHGMDVAHNCNNKSCVEWTHLYLATRAQNTRDAYRDGLMHPNNGNSAKTHCPKGHPYSVDNVYVRAGTNRRDCRTCRSEYAKRRRN